MARGTYILPFTNITLANQAVTLAFLNPGTNATLEILRAAVGQSANATSAMQRVQLSTQVTAFPTLVSATPVATSIIDQASKITGGTAGAAGTCGINASAEGAGAKTVLLSDQFNVLNGWLWVPIPEDRPVLSAGSTSGIGLVFPAAPATLTGWSGYIEFREW